jgi:hypothetical protein
VNHTVPANVIESQLPRVVTPEARSAARPRVPARARNLSPINLSQGDLLDMGSATHAIAFGNNQWTNVPMMKSVLHPITGKEIQYKDLMKDPKLGPLYKKVMGNELGRLCQGIRVEIANIPKEHKIIYGNLYVTINHIKHKNNGSG